ncbi:hypothetical protein [Methanobacterium sp.]|uniref:hypothetical protein n=1 Tax=Methanobacterium sp. TaxID=2164 RepID=UPI003C745FDB
MVNDGMTAGYDIVIELNKGFLDRLIAAAFYTIGSMRFYGTMDLPEVFSEDLEIGAISSAVSAAVSGTTEVEYDVRVNKPPRVYAFKDNLIQIVTNLDISLTVLGDTEVDLDSTVFADVEINFESNEIVVYPKDAEIGSVSINEEHIFSRNLINQFVKITGEIIKEKLLEKYEKIRIPVTSFSTPVPVSHDLLAMPEGKNEAAVTIGDPEKDEKGFNLAVEGLKTLNENEIAVCMNLMGHAGGDITKVSDFSGGHDIGIGISEDGMCRVFKFWWENTTYPKYEEINGTYSVPLDLTGTLTDMVELGAELFTLGFLEGKWDVQDISFNYRAEVSINEMPDFNLKGDNKIAFTFKGMRLSAHADLIFAIASEVVLDTSDWVPDWATPWKDDVTIDTYFKNIGLFDDEIGINVKKAEGKIYLDDRNRLMAKIEDLDIDFDLGWDLPEVVLNWIVEFTGKILAAELPAFPLSSALIAKDVPDLKLNLETDINKLVINDVEAVFGADFKIKETERVISNPKFVANIDPNSLEVHRISSEYAQRVLEVIKLVIMS